ncbi:Protein of unknown function [Palleronia marisminoris]|uniref:DUF2380 domain-containing protein n=1 Tax=Palleronia marisminoris TaxID=315423 RepID=A0A1Y5SFS3_9RHOB|nr:DUF3280 domain-containing protein [Palleronia marisminoris]SFG72213.1 Protein of unknown function [Palleronia marisminoris]SLN36959.1 hypothetical protein PAM7066_01575 [Palleronia marisminoris]
MKKIAVVLIAVACLAALPATAQDGAPVDVAVFDFELIDSSLEGEMMGENPDETRRTAALGAQLRQAFDEADGFEVIDIAPVADEASRRSLQRCGGCDVTLAGQVGAELAVTGTVQKVSNLILNINIYIRDVETGETLRAMSADIRGNTDESWQRGMDWLIRNRLDLGA